MTCGSLNHICLHVDPTDPTRFVEMDNVFRAFTSIDTTHHQIHEGESFYVNRFFTGVASGANIDFLGITPDDDKRVHFVVEASATGEFEFHLYEGVTTSNNGTQVQAFNRERDSAITPLTTAFSSPTVTDLGTEIAQFYAGAGRSIGGTARSAYELVLKRNTKYMARITSRATSIAINVIFDWYEQDPNV